MLLSDTSGFLPHVMAQQGNQLVHITPWRVRQQGWGHAVTAHHSTCCGMNQAGGGAQQTAPHRLPESLKHPMCAVLGQFSQSSHMRQHLRDCSKPMPKQTEVAADAGQAMGSPSCGAAGRTRHGLTCISCRLVDDCLLLVSVSQKCPVHCLPAAAVFKYPCPTYYLFLS